MYTYRYSREVTVTRSDYCAVCRTRLTHSHYSAVCDRHIEAYNAMWQPVCSQLTTASLDGVQRAQDRVLLTRQVAKETP